MISHLKRALETTAEFDGKEKLRLPLVVKLCLQANVLEKWMPTLEHYSKTIQLLVAMPARVLKILT